MAVKGILFYLFCFIAILAISYLLNAGIVWLIFWLLGWTFTWKYATVIWLVLILLGGLFK